MTGRKSRKPVWGAPDAKLSDFTQKERPHHAFVRLVGGDKKSMELCPVYAENWKIRARTLSVKKKRDNLCQKEGEGAMREAAADAGVAVRKQPVRKRSRSSAADVPLFQADATNHCPATMVPPPHPPFTQRTSRSGRVVSASPLRGVSQAYSAPRNREPPTSTASNPYTASRRTSSRKFAYHSAPAQSYGAGMQSTDLPQAASTTSLETTPSTAASSSMQLPQHLDHNVVVPATGASYALEDSTTQRAMPSHLYVPQVYHYQTADHVRVGFPTSPLPDRRSLKPPTYTTHQPYNPRPGLINELGQYATSVPYYHGRAAWHGLDATSHAQTTIPGPPYMGDGAYTSAQPATPLDSDTRDRGSRMDSLLPATGTWPGNPEFEFATPPFPQTPSQSYPSAMGTYEPGGGTKYLGVAYQDFSRSDSRPSSSLASSTVPAPALGIAECDLKTVQQVNSGYAPQAYAPTIIDDNVGVVAPYHSASDERQDPHNACETYQIAYPSEGEYAIAWSTPSAIPSVDCKRSVDIGGATKSTYVYDAKVLFPVQDQLVVPRTISDADGHLPKQSSYSELSQALGEPAPMSMQPIAPSSMKLATGSSTSSTVPPDPHISFRALPSSSALVGPYARLQGTRPHRRPRSVWYEHSPLVIKCAYSSSGLR